MKKVVSVLSIFTILFLASCSSAEIVLNGKNKVYLNVYDEYVEEGATISKGELITTGEVDTNKPGTYVIRYENKDGSVVVKRTVLVVDTIKPVIELKDEPKDHEVYVLLGEDFKTPDATVTDNYDKNLSLNVSNNVDTSKIGYYSVIYMAEDSSGNEANTVILQVEVVDPEPQIVLNGTNKTTILNTDEYVEKGAKAYDAFGQEIEVTIDGALESEVGVYELIYSATDSYGNSSEKTRTVRVGEMSSINYEGSVDVRTSRDGGYFVFNKKDLYLQKIKDGEEIFRISTEFSKGVGMAMLEDSKGNIILSYSYPYSYISKYNSDGEKIWTYERKGDMFYTSSIVEADNGYFYIGHVGDVDNVIYGYLDMDGNFMWENTITSEEYIFADDAIFYNNNLYFLYNTFTRSDLRGVKVSLDGEAKEFSLEDNIYDFTISDEYGLLGLGHDYIYRIDKDFNKKEVIELPRKPHSRIQLVGIDSLDDGSFLIVTSGNVWNMNSNGDVIFDSQFPEIDDEINAHVTINENDLIIVYPRDLGDGIYLYENIFG